MAKYTVLAPLVQLKVRDATGALVFRQFYAGAVLDDEQLDVAGDGLRRHLDEGMVVEESEEVAVVFAVPAGTPVPGRPPNVEVTEAGNTGQPVPPLEPDLLRAAEIDATGDEPFAAGSTDLDNPAGQFGDGKPDGRSSQTAWREYHARQLVAAGQDEDDARAEAEGLSKAELVALYK